MLSTTTMTANAETIEEAYCNSDSASCLYAQGVSRVDRCNDYWFFFFFLKSILILQ